MRRIWWSFLLVLGMVLLAPTTVHATQDDGTILVLNSYHQGFSWTDEEMKGILQEIDESGLELEIFIEYLDWKKFPTDWNLQGFRDLIEQKYYNSNLDIILCTDDSAFTFARENRDELFKGVPIVFCGVDGLDYEELSSNQDNYTGVMQIMNPYGTIQAAKAIDPDLQTIYVVYDNTGSGQAIGELCARSAKQVSANLEVVLLNDLGTDVIYDTVSKAKEHSIVLMTNYVLSDNWTYMSQERFCEQVAMRSAVPVYHLYQFGLGHGMLGGDLILGSIQGEQAASQAIRILRGEGANQIPILNEDTNQMMFDFAVMQKFGVSRDELPENSVVINSPIDFFQMYKVQIIGAIVVFILLLAFTISLLFYIRKIRSMQKTLKENHEELTELYEEITASEEEMRAQYDEIIEAHELLEVSNHKLVQLTEHDTLTGLYNRYYLYEVIDNLLRESQDPGALYFLDLDNFKYVNDTLGHSVGDILLQNLSTRMNGILEAEIHLVRLGGDEFVFFYPSVSDKILIENFAKKILAIFEEPFLIEENNLIISASVGIAISPQNGNTMELLLKNADMAMYYIKNKGKNGYYFFDDSLDLMMWERVSIERKFKKAMEENEFYVVYQPQICPVSGEVEGFEALLRWRSDGVLIPPLKFIQIAEENGFIIQLGEWVLRQACKDIVKLNKERNTNYRISVNVSVIQLLQSDFVQTVLGVVQETGLSPEQLILEVTESVFMESAEYIAEQLKRLRNEKIEIALDDFGTGYSSLAYLKDFPITIIKVDKIFIDSILGTQSIHNITDTIINLGHELHLKVVAEGVEEKEQVSFLLNSQCDLIQGFFYAKPMTMEDLVKWLGIR